MDQASEKSGELMEHQDGFPDKHSTLDAVSLVIDFVRIGKKGKRWERGKKRYCVIITLDVKWRKIHEALRK